MKEQKRVVGQMFDGNRYDFSRACKTSMSMSHKTLRLQGARAQPLLSQREARTAMIVLFVGHPNRNACPEIDAVPDDTVWNIREEFSQVKRSVCIVAGADQKNLSVEFVDTANGTSGTVRRKGDCIPGDPGRLRSNSGKSEEVSAATDAGHSPENIRNNPEIARGRSCQRIECFIVISRPGWHYQGAPRPQRIPERTDQAGRSSLDWPHGTE